MLKEIGTKYRNWLASIEERELTKEENSLQDSAILLASMLSFDRRVPPVAIDLQKRKGGQTPQSYNESLFVAYATLYIPDDSGTNIELLRTIFGKGSFLLFRRQTLKNLALDNGISWRDGLGYYRRAAKIVSDNQLARAKFELTGKT